MGMDYGIYAYKRELYEGDFTEEEVDKIIYTLNIRDEKYNEFTGFDKINKDATKRENLLSALKYFDIPPFTYDWDREDKDTNEIKDLLNVIELFDINSSDYLFETLDFSNYILNNAVYQDTFIEGCMYGVHGEELDNLITLLDTYISKIQQLERKELTVSITETLTMLVKFITVIEEAKDTGRYILFNRG